MISVIVPVYNVENYVGRCIESILRQTYTDFELILVNDGSTDHSLAICESYAIIDTRIKLISKVNGGLSDARNAGLDICAGDYITFIDSDDYISPYMFEDIMAALVEHKVDIGMCSFKRVYEETVISNFERGTNVEILDSKECYKNIYSSRCDEFTVAWAKIYKKELFEHIRYPYGKLHEDEFVTYKLFTLAERIVYLDAAYYFYLIRKQSIMHTAFSKESLVRLEAYSERIKFFVDINEHEIAAMAAKRYIDKSAEYYVHLKDNSRKNIRNQAIDLYKIYNKSFAYGTLREKITIKSFTNCLVFFWLHYYFVKIGIAVKGVLNNEGIGRDVG